MLWGERCIELDRGREVFCADRDVYHGHSDVIQPILDLASGRWFVYTCRESHNVPPRVALFDNTGARIWGQVEKGHIDIGWVARLGEDRRHVATAIRISKKACGPGGHVHHDREEFAFDALTGEPISLPFSVYRTLPVDINGDGYHELVHEIPGSDCELLDRHGNIIGSLEDPVALACKFTGHPGEQLLSYRADGTIRIWADRNAEDTEAALARYGHPFYRANLRLMCSGGNEIVLAGV